MISGTIILHTIRRQPNISSDHNIKLPHYHTSLRLRIGSTPIDLEAIEPKPLYESPFKLTDIPHCDSADTSLSLIPIEVIVKGTIVLADGSPSENVEVVILRRDIVGVSLGERMIRKKMTPETKPEDII